MTAELGIFTIKVLYLFILAVVLAIVEIQIEGKHGWAANLPAWKPQPGSRADRLVRGLTKKDLTGYHLSLFGLLILFFHLPFVWDGHWSIAEELETLAFFFLFAVVWDFLWFVLNPHYSVRDFTPENVWWHRHWVFGWPTDYFMGIAFTTVLWIPRILEDRTQGLAELAALLGANAILTAALILCYPHSNGKPGIIRNSEAAQSSAEKHTS